MRGMPVVQSPLRLERRRKEPAVELAELVEAPVSSPPLPFSFLVRRTNPFRQRKCRTIPFVLRHTTLPSCLPREASSHSTPTYISCEFFALATGPTYRMVPRKPSESRRRVQWGIRSVVVVVGEEEEGEEGGKGEEEEEEEEAMVACLRALSFGLK